MYSRPVSVGYHANVISCATCLFIPLFVGLIIAPYLIAYAMGDFWYKEAFIHHRPEVRFRHEAVVEAYEEGSYTRYGWSTSASLNAALGDRFRSFELRAWEMDADRDGSPESLSFALSTRTPGRSLVKVALLVGLEVEFDDEAFAPLRLNGTALASHASPMPGARHTPTLLHPSIKHPNQEERESAGDLHRCAMGAER